MGMPVHGVNKNFRKKVFNKGHDKKVFSRTGGMTHKLNSVLTPMRGGYRL